MAAGLTALAGLAAAFLLARRLTPSLAAFLARRGLLAASYRREPIPTCLGLVVLAAALPGYIGAATLLPGERAAVMGTASAVLLAALAGLVDDVAGEGDPKGVRGHLAALRGGRWTAGTLKAAGLAGAGLLAAAATATDAVRFALTTLLVPLAANAVNGFDLRPGRAGKAFLAGALLLAVMRAPLGLLLVAPLAGGLAGYLPWDLRGRVMLGDAGANLLGAGLGVAAALTLPPAGQAAALALLLALHLIVERRSLSTAIERSPFLRALDGLGRR